MTRGEPMQLVSQHERRLGGRGSRRASWGKDWLGRWLTRRLALPIFSQLLARYQFTNCQIALTELWLELYKKFFTSMAKVVIRTKIQELLNGEPQIGN